MPNSIWATTFRNSPQSSRHRNIGTFTSSMDYMITERCTSSARKSMRMHGINI